MTRSTKSLVAVLAGFVALGFFLMALIYWSAFAQPAFSFDVGKWDWTLRALIIVAIVSFAVFLLVSPESVGQVAGKRSTRLSANALVASLVALGIAVVINLIVSAVPTVRADWTAGQDFTLSEQTIRVLEGLKSDVNAVAFVCSDPRNQNCQAQQVQQAGDLLKEYASHTSHFKYQIVDPYQNRALALQYGITRLGSVVFSNGQRSETANTISEADFTGALVRLGQTGTKTVAFLTGHGEIDPNGAQQDGYSQIKSTLEKDNYTTIAWNLVTSPTITLQQATVLVIAKPQAALNQKEVQAIQSYLDGGGHALILLDPQMSAEALQPFTTMLRKYGVTPVQGIILDQQSASAQSPTVVLVNSYPDNPITRDLAGFSTVFPLSMGLKPPTSTLGAFEVNPIVQSSQGADKSWLETDLKNQQAQYDEGKDVAGPVDIALSVGPPTLTASTPETATTQPKTRLVVFGDSDFATNLAVQQYAANLDLVANSVSWLAGSNELVSIRPKPASTPRTVTLDTGQKNLIFTSTVLVLPVLVLLAGAFVWWRRR